MKPTSSIASEHGSLDAATVPPPASTTLLPLVEKIFSQDPVATAQHLENLDPEVALSALTQVHSDQARQVFSKLNDSFAAALIPRLPDSLLHHFCVALEPARGANLFQLLPPETRKTFLDCVSPKRRRLIRDHLAYPKDSAGRIMTTHFTALRGTMTAKAALQKIRQHMKSEPFGSYLYVVDPEGHLTGVANSWGLLVADESATLDSIARKEVFSVDCFMDREQVARLMSHKNYFAVPVVDSEKRLLGIVRAEHLIGDVQEEASEDLQMIFGAGADERPFSPVSLSLRQRLPWLHINLATAFLAAAVVGLFESTIAKITVLAIFLPVVAGQGGNAGAQSLAVVMRGLVMREIPAHRRSALVAKEALIGLVNGLVIGLVTGLVAWLWHGNAWLGVVIGLGMIVNLVAAGMAGAAIPLIMKSLGLDPAQSSNIILTTVTDVLGFFAFLGFAVLFQDKLI